MTLLIGAWRCISSGIQLPDVLCSSWNGLPNCFCRLYCHLFCNHWRPLHRVSLGTISYCSSTTKLMAIYKYQVLKVEWWLSFWYLGEDLFWVRQYSFTQQRLPLMAILAEECIHEWEENCGFDRYILYWVIFIMSHIMQCPKKWKY